MSTLILMPLLHHRLACRLTGCLHCARCDLGPQPVLIYAWTSDGTDTAEDRTKGEGLCPHCAGFS